MENPIEMDDLDWFGGTPILWNLQINYSEVYMPTKIGQSFGCSFRRCQGL
jgi:hypothetical protein